jgi:putative hydrolase of the HAD superfamily
MRDESPALACHSPSHGSPCRAIAGRRYPASMPPTTNDQPPTPIIKGLIFDYGGVLWDMRWDITRTLEQEHGLAERTIVETLYGSDTWRQLEIGVGDRQAWLDESHLALERVAGRELPRLHAHWRDRQHLIAPNIDLIRRLRPPYRTAVLSNADSTLVDRLRHEHGIADLFDDVICSADIGVAKPEPRIYAIAAARVGLPADECVFIDDLERNVDAARAAGMHAVLYRVDAGDDLESQLRALGVLPRPA